MNRNADALSQLPGPVSPEAMVTVAPGISVPLPRVFPTSSNMPEVPCFLIDAFQKGQPPTSMERKEVSSDVLELVRQWQRIRDCEGVLYRHVQPPEGVVASGNLCYLVPFKVKYLQPYTMIKVIEVETRAEILKETFNGTCANFIALRKAIPPHITQKGMDSHCPFELMFGQKPCLPVDALLGTLPEGQYGGPADDWIKGHQEYLQSAYELASWHLQKAAAQQVWQQPEGNAELLPPGTVVYKRNCAPGQHKIQDVWDPKRYVIVKHLDDVGRVHTISPVEGNGSENNVLWTKLRVAPVPTSQITPGEDEEMVPPPVPMAENQGDDSEEEEWAGPVVVVATHNSNPRSPPASLRSPRDIPMANLNLSSDTFPATTSSVH
ncbi:hypothetical protein SRHO_G00088980 [Serrasalmus rhombeus]